MPERHETCDASIESQFIKSSPHHVLRSDPGILPEPLMSEQSDISGVLIRPLKRYQDARGWLTELFRDDELPDEFRPVMSYLSVTHAGVARGPHEHVDQTDGFAFIDGSYRLYLWDNREG